MGMKFDGTYFKNGSTTLGNVKDGKNLRDGQSSGGRVLGNVADGKNIRDGQSSAGRTIIKIADAAKKIGTSSQGPTTALVWYFFAK